jgi:hypothetical protein
VPWFVRNVATRSTGSLSIASATRRQAAGSSPRIPWRIGPGALGTQTAAPVSRSTVSQTIGYPASAAAKRLSTSTSRGVPQRSSSRYEIRSVVQSSNATGAPTAASAPMRPRPSTVSASVSPPAPNAAWR